MNHTDPLGECLAVLWLVLVCSRKPVTQLHRGFFFFFSKCNKKLSSRLAALSNCLCSNANELSSSVVPTGPFVPLEAVPFLPDVLSELDCLSERDPGDPQSTLSAPGPLLSFITGDLLCPPGSTQKMAPTSKTLDF